MKQKILFILLSIIFIVVIIYSNLLLQEESNKKIGYENKINNEIETNNNQKEENEVEILKVSKENFEDEVLKSQKTVLIDFYADWCGPCKMLSPIVEEIAKEKSEIKVVKINVDEQQELAIEYNVMSIPTLVVIKDGQEVNRVVGLISKSEIESMIE